MASVLPWVFLVLAVTLYTWRLGEMPTYITPDEAIIAVDAHALATTGKDVHGSTLPLFFFIQLQNSERTGWFTPAIFYLSAFVQILTPFTEWSVRLPTVIVGMANIILLYVLAMRLFGRQWLAIATAGLLALSPAHYILSRYSMDYLYPVPFLIAWLIAVHRALEKPTPRNWAICGLCLGIGFYSYASSVFLTPALIALTGVAAIGRSGEVKRALPVVLAYGIPISFFAVWLFLHPEVFQQTVVRYNFYDPKKLGPLQGFREFLSFNNIERMVSIYWSFFSPSFLFLSGDQMITYSTRLVGALPMMMAILMPLGFAQIVERERNAFAWIVVAGFFLGPLPAVIVPEHGAMNRAISMAPFAVLIAGYGLKFLSSLATIQYAKPVARWVGGAVALSGLVYAAVTLAEGRLGGSAPAMLIIGIGLSLFAILSGRFKQGPMLAAGVLAIALLQFTGFTRDYFGDYRVRINSWLGGNLRGALEEMIARQPAGGSSQVYFAHLAATNGLADIRNYFMDTYWHFYLTKHGRIDLLDRTAPFDPASLDAIPAGSLILGNKGERVVEGLIESGKLEVVAAIPEMDRDPYFLILEKRGS